MPQREWNRLRLANRNTSSVGIMNILTSKVVNTCIDSLYLRLLSSSLPSEWLKSRLDDWRKFKSDYSYEEPEELFQDFPGLGRFSLHPKGSKPYEFVFKNPEIGDIRIWNPDKWSKSLATGQIYLDFSSRYLQQQTLYVPASIDFCDRIFDLLFSSRLDSERILVSRADLTADVQTQGFDWSDMQKFCYRSRKRDNFCGSLDTDNLVELRDYLRQLDTICSNLGSPLKDNKGGDNAKIALEFPPHLTPVIMQALHQAVDGVFQDAQLTRLCCTTKPKTFYFGRFASELCARIYHKSETLEIQHKQYMRDVWQSNGWDGETDVWRIEFSLTGDFLKNAYALFDQEGSALDLRDLSNFLVAMPRIWTYLTTTWLRHCEPSDDTHRHRWASSDIWQAVQSAFDYDDQTFQRFRKPAPNVDQLKAQAMGCVVSWVALAESGDSALGGFDEVFSQIKNHLFNEKFMHQVSDRRNRLGCDEYSDAAISAHFRSLTPFPG